VKLAVGYHLRHHAGHRSLKQMIAAGAIGKPRHIDLTWTYKAPEDDWRKDPARSPWWALAAVGTHSIDLVSYLLDTRVVSARTWTLADEGENEYAAHSELRFESGATGRILVSNRIVAPRLIEIKGDDGKVICEKTLGAYGSGDILINGVPVPFRPEDPYEAQLRAFVEAIQEGRDPEVGGNVGLQNLRDLLLVTKDARRYQTQTA